MKRDECWLTMLKVSIRVQWKHIILLSPKRQRWAGYKRKSWPFEQSQIKKYLIHPFWTQIVANKAGHACTSLLWTPLLAVLDIFQNFHGTSLNYDAQKSESERKFMHYSMEMKKTIILIQKHKIRFCISDLALQHRIPKSNICTKALIKHIIWNNTHTCKIYNTLPFKFHNIELVNILRSPQPHWDTENILCWS